MVSVGLGGGEGDFNIPYEGRALGIDVLFFSAINDKRTYGTEPGEPTPSDKLAWLFGDDVPDEVKTLERHGTMFIGEKGRLNIFSLVVQTPDGEVKSAVVVGAGFIGVEVALLLADLGLDVTMVEQQDRVMPGMLDAETAEIVGQALAERGVRVRTGTQAAAFAGNGRADALVGRVDLGTISIAVALAYLDLRGAVGDSRIGVLQVGVA